MNTFKRHLAAMLIGLPVCLLIACGGGGGSASSSAAPIPAPPAATLSLTPQSTKTFHFSWAPISAATGYVLLEDADGTSGYTPVARLPAETSAYDHEVFLPARVNARYILQTCNAGACADSAAVSVSGTLAGATGYVKPSVQELDGGFGISVALSGDGLTMAVGMPLEDSNARGIGTGGDAANDGAEDSGAVYVFARTSDGWSQQAYVKASNTQALDRFGSKVALSPEGNTLAVGAVTEDSSATGINGNQADDSAVDSGALYLFVRRSGHWAQQAYVKAPNTDAGDRFGGGNFGTHYAAGLALGGPDSAPTLAVGAPYEASSATGINGNQPDNSLRSGAVYLY